MNARLANLSLLILFPVSFRIAISSQQTMDTSYAAINSSVSPAKIQTIEDSQAAFRLILQKYGIPADELPPSLTDAVAGAEISALHNTKSLIPESNVATGFNYVVREIGQDSAQTITTSELHYFRQYLALLMPDLVLKKKEGEISSQCRPIEAAYLMVALLYNGGISDSMRAAYRSHKSVPKKINTRSVRGELKPSAGPPPTKLISGIVRFVQTHSGKETQQQIIRLLTTIGLEDSKNAG